MGILDGVHNLFVERVVDGKGDARRTPSFAGELGQLHGGNGLACELHNAYNLFACRARKCYGAAGFAELLHR